MKQPGYYLSAAVKRLLAGFLVIVGSALVCKAANATDADLAAARARLAELRQTCKAQHPEVQAQLKLISDLEIQRKAQASSDPELTKARLQLAELRKTCKENHPAVRAQSLKVAELESARQASK